MNVQFKGCVFFVSDESGVYSNSKSCTDKLTDVKATCRIVGFDMK